MEKIKVTIWNEGRHEKNMEAAKAIYPNGIHNAIKANLDKMGENFEIRVATLDDPDQGLPDELLNDTDVLLWWGHMAHECVPDELVEKVYNRVMCGMGFIALHSAHFSKPFKRLMGSTCSLKWRDGDRERLWCVLPSHEIAKDVPEQIVIPVEEMYGERFDVPTPDELIFIGWFNGGEVFRSGCAWNKGLGRVFYFQPGHESNPTYHIPEVQKIITNAVHWANPNFIAKEIECPWVPSQEEELLNAQK